LLVHADYIPYEFVHESDIVTARKMQILSKSSLSLQHFTITDAVWFYSMFLINMEFETKNATNKKALNGKQQVWYLRGSKQKLVRKT
jgi:hypothetical protein